jgi:hypothetical protein
MMQLAADERNCNKDIYDTTANELIELMYNTAVSKKINGVGR